MSSAIHIAITRRVKPGCEEAFEERLKQFAHESLTVPGTTGVQLITPQSESGPREFGILRSFKDTIAKDAFYQSDVFSRWTSDIESMVEGDSIRRELHGLEAWFNQSDLPRPQRWKMAIATLLGVYPTSLLLGTFAAPMLHGMPKALASLVIAICMVISLTWLVMPIVTRILHRWLHPDSH